MGVGVLVSLNVYVIKLCWRTSEDICLGPQKLEVLSDGYLGLMRRVCLVFIMSRDETLIFLWDHKNKRIIHYFCLKKKHNRVRMCGPF